jgi:hypothetical protein
MQVMRTRSSVMVRTSREPHRSSLSRAEQKKVGNKSNSRTVCAPGGYGMWRWEPSPTVYQTHRYPAGDKNTRCWETDKPQGQTEIETYRQTDRQTDKK